MAVCIMLTTLSYHRSLRPAHAQRSQSRDGERTTWWVDGDLMYLDVYRYVLTQHGIQSLGLFKDLYRAKTIHSHNNL